MSRRNAVLRRVAGNPPLRRVELDDRGVEVALLPIQRLVEVLHRVAEMQEEAVELLVAGVQRAGHLAGVLDEAAYPPEDQSEEEEPEPDRRISQDDLPRAVKERVNHRDPAQPVDEIEKTVTPRDDVRRLLRNRSPEPGVRPDAAVE